MINLINVYAVAGIMKNTLPILCYLIFNNILLVFFANQRSLKNKIIKKLMISPEINQKTLNNKSRKKKGNKGLWLKIQVEQYEKLFKKKKKEDIKALPYSFFLKVTITNWRFL